MLTGHLSIGRRPGGVTGRICDTGQNALQYSIQTESSSSPIEFHIVFFMAYIEEIFIRNILIILRIY